MTDEEKKAIETIQEFRKTGFYTLNLKYNNRVQTTRHIEIAIDILLNLIQKQEKLIQGLNKQVDEFIQKMNIYLD